MKKILILSLSILFLVSCGEVEDQYYGSDVSGKTDVIEAPYIVDWDMAADSLTNAMLSKFWVEYSTGKGFFGYTPGETEWKSHYWPQAHAMDAVIDAYMRAKGSGKKVGNSLLVIEGTDPNMTLEDYYYSFFEKWYIGIGEKNEGYRNAFIDDMEWVTLTMIRLYEVTNEAKYLTTAKQVYDDWIITEWSEEEGGGLLWSTSEKERSKNACSNAPGGIISCWLYKHVTDADDKAKYLNDAKRIYEWQRAVLFNQETGAVYDNIKNGKISTVTLTYNQGTFMGLAHELYMITKEDHYLKIAIKTANYTMTNNVNDSKLLLRDEGNGDNGLFKGIFARYLTTLANDSNVDQDTHKNFVRFLKNNGVSLWTAGVSKAPDRVNYLLCGTSWDTQPAASTQITTQASGSMLIEAMNRLPHVE